MYASCYSSLRPHSPQVDSAESQELRRLRERIALLPPQQPFQELEVIATLGIGGFGRVELVNCSNTIVPQLSLVINQLSLIVQII